MTFLGLYEYFSPKYNKKRKRKSKIIKLLILPYIFPFFLNNYNKNHKENRKNTSLTHPNYLKFPFRIDTTHLKIGENFLVRKVVYRHKYIIIKTHVAVKLLYFWLRLMISIYYWTLYIKKKKIKFTIYPSWWICFENIDI